MDIGRPASDAGRGGCIGVACPLGRAAGVPGVLCFGFWVGPFCHDPSMPGPFCQDPSMPLSAVELVQHEDCPVITLHGPGIHPGGHIHWTLSVQWQPP